MSMDEKIAERDALQVELNGWSSGLVNYEWMIDDVYQEFRCMTETNRTTIKGYMVHELNRRISELDRKIGLL